MLHTFVKHKSAIMAVAFLFASAPFALAHEKPASTSPAQKQHYQTSTTPASSTMHMQDQQAISATVSEVNQQDSRVSLRLDDGNTVDLQVPQAVLSDLQQGDSVEVSIRKTNNGQQPGMSNSQPSRPGSSSLNPPSQPKAGQMK